MAPNDEFCSTTFVLLHVAIISNSCLALFLFHLFSVTCHRHRRRPHARALVGLRVDLDLFLVRRPLLKLPFRRPILLVDLGLELHGWNRRLRLEFFANLVRAPDVFRNIGHLRLVADSPHALPHALRLLLLMALPDSILFLIKFRL